MGGYLGIRVKSTLVSKFNEVYENRNQYHEEIANYLKRLSRYIDVALNHILDEGIPSTNNTIEWFFKITLPCCNKKKNSWPIKDWLIEFY